MTPMTYLVISAVVQMENTTMTWFCFDGPLTYNWTDQVMCVLDGAKVPRDHRHSPHPQFCPPPYSDPPSHCPPPPLSSSTFSISPSSSSSCSSSPSFPLLL